MIKNCKGECEYPCKEPDYKHVGFIDTMPLYYSPTDGLALDDGFNLIPLNKKQKETAMIFFTLSKLEEILEKKQ